MLSNCKDTHMRWILARQMFCLHRLFGTSAVALQLAKRVWVLAHALQNWAGDRSSLPSFFLSNQQDRIRAFEITAGCKLVWKCLCSHLTFPPTLGKIFIWIWSMNYHTAGLDYVFILSSSFFSWNQFIDMVTRTFFCHVFFSAVGYASFW